MSIPFVTFGQRELSRAFLPFFHGNGFPPQAYSRLLNQLGSDNRVEAMLFRPLWPADLLTTRNVEMNSMTDWSPLVADAEEFLQARNQGQGAIGIGHSLGGIIHLWTALKRPDLYKGVVLVDPVLLPSSRLWLFSIARALGFGQRVHPLIQSALRRKRDFKSIDEALARYRQTRLFAQMSDEAVNDYVRSLFQPTDPSDERVTLQYPPEWEAKIYETLSVSHLWRDLPTLVPPILILRGATSDTLSSEATAAVLKKLPNARIIEVPQSGHLVPLERPEFVAEKIDQFVREVL